MKFLALYLTIFFAVRAVNAQPLNKSVAAQSQASKLQIKLDLENARKTILFLDRKTATAAELKAWVELPGTEALFSKVKSNADTAISAMKKAMSGQSLTAEEKKFQFEFIVKNISTLKDFMGRLDAGSDSIRTALIDKLGRYLPKDSSASITLFGLMGGYSSGFAFTDDPTAFFMGLHFYRNDVIGVTVAAEHELFHTLQTANYRYKPTMQRIKNSDTTLEAPYYLLTHLFLEGSAENIANGKAYIAISPYLKNEYDHLVVNNYRRDAAFYIVERLILDSYHHAGDMNFDNVYSILFDWNWNNPAYFAGNEMVTALIKYNGQEYLNKSLQRDAMYFVRDYIDLERSGKQSGMYVFSADFSRLVDRLLGYAK